MCPGYVDGGDNCVTKKKIIPLFLIYFQVKGDDYIFCNQTFTLKEITRPKWE